MVFESLQRFGSKADRVLFFPEEWDTEIGDGGDRNSQLLVKARDWYGVDLVPVNEVEYAALVGDGKRAEKVSDTNTAGKQSHKRSLEDDSNAHDEKDDGKKNVKKNNSGWENSFMKFLAWGQTQYDRVIHLDSDITLTSHMDELFLLPSAPVAMMRAYWLLSAEHALTTLFILLEPSEAEFQRLMRAAKSTSKKKGNRDWDMEILNRLYGDEAIVLPHKGYGVLTGEFRTHDHSNYLGTSTPSDGGWNANTILSSTKLIHFSDWPLPKPWIMWPHTLLPEIQPRCRYLDSGIVDQCDDKKVWMGVYDEFRKRRKDVCKLLSEVSPEWPPGNGTLELEWWEERRGKR